jgi:hypothetical protein
MTKSAPVTLPARSAGQQQHQVGDFLRPGEASGCRRRRGLLGDGFGIATCGRRDGGRYAMVTQPQVRGYRTRADCV